QVVELAVGDLDPPLDLVVPRHDAVERVLQADDAVGVVAARRALLAIGAVVARLFAPGHRRLAHGVELFLRLVGIVGVAGGDQLFGDFAVAVDARGLVDGAFVVVQAQPVHRLQDRVDGFLRAALAVGVLDAQDELPAAAARLQPAVQRGARAADVQVAGGTGCEAGAAGHGRPGETVESRNFTVARGCDPRRRHPASTLPTGRGSPDRAPCRKARLRYAIPGAAGKPPTRRGT